MAVHSPRQQPRKQRSAGKGGIGGDRRAPPNSTETYISRGNIRKHTTPRGWCTSKKTPTKTTTPELSSPTQTLPLDSMPPCSFCFPPSPPLSLPLPLPPALFFPGALLTSLALAFRILVDETSVSIGGWCVSTPSSKFSVSSLTPSPAPPPRRIHQQVHNSHHNTACTRSAEYRGGGGRGGRTCQSY